MKKKIKTMSESRIKPISSRLCDLLCKHSYLTFEDTYMALDITEAQLKTAIGNYNYSNRFNGGSLISRYQLEEDQIVCFEHNKPAGALPVKKGGELLKKTRLISSLRKTINSLWKNQQNLQTTYRQPNPSAFVRAPNMTMS